MASLLLALPVMGEGSGFLPPYGVRSTGAGLRSDAERVPDQAVRSGSWVDIRDAGGGLLYRRVVTDPLIQEFETHDATGFVKLPRPLRERRSRRNLLALDPLPPPRTYVVVPDLPGAASIEIFATLRSHLGSQSAVRVGDFAPQTIPIRTHGPGKTVSAVDWLHGDVRRAFVLALLGDGFTRREMGAFHQHAKHLADALLSDPAFAACAEKIGIVRFDVVSNQSGADDPTDCGGCGTVVDTAFDAAHCNYEERRLVLVNSDAVIDTVYNHDAALLNAMCLVIVNSKVYGGGNWGTVATATVTPPSCGADWAGVALHEVGHFFGLDEEYDYAFACHDSNQVFPYTEPAGANVTTATSAQELKDFKKWDADPAAAVPTVRNPDPKVCDKRAFADLGIKHRAGVIGTFEGAATYHSGVYRPQYACRMRDARRPFCAVCASHIANSI